VDLGTQKVTRLKGRTLAGTGTIESFCIFNRDGEKADAFFNSFKIDAARNALSVPGTPFQHANYKRWKQKLLKAGLLHDSIAEARFKDFESAGPYELNLERIGDIGALRGMPLWRLQLEDCAVTDLRPLEGSAITWFQATNTPIQNLEPLRMLPLTLVYLSNTAVTDLTPLAGKRIQVLKIDGSEGITDLSPLKRMKLTKFDASATNIRDLSPLRGNPLEELYLGNTQVSDLSPLRGMPLHKIELTNTPVTDISPLAECKELESLILPEGVRELDGVRQLPRLTRLQWGESGFDESPQAKNAMTASQFWKAYDEKKSGRDRSSQASRDVVPK
jgi:hypothetical protein